MQCANCQFYNMPGLAVCGRCGSSLALADDIDVHPPRAAARSRKLRRVFVYPFSRRWFSLWHGIARGSQALGQQLRMDLDVDLPERGVLLRSVVPGLAHVAAGHVTRGRIFLWLYLALALSGLFLFGTTLGSILLGLAFSVHVSSVIDLLGSRGSVRQRIVAALITLCGVVLFFYTPLGWLASRVASARVLNQDMGIFRRGDVVLINQWDRPDPGRVALFFLDREVRENAPQQHTVYVVPAGERVVRVIAGPGQRVEWDGKELRVDGEVLDMARLGIEPRRLPVENPFVVPVGFYLVQPAGVPEVDARLHSAAWRATSLAREEHIRGTIYMIYQPLRRRSWVR